jgi:hypothetical protein
MIARMMCDDVCVGVVFADVCVGVVFALQQRLVAYSDDEYVELAGNLLADYGLLNATKHYVASTDLTHIFGDTEAEALSYPRVFQSLLALPWDGAHRGEALARHGTNTSTGSDIVWALQTHDWPRCAVCGRVPVVPLSL